MKMPKTSEAADCTPLTTPPKTPCPMLAAPFWKADSTESTVFGSMSYLPSQDRISWRAALSWWAMVGAWSMRPLTMMNTSAAAATTMRTVTSNAPIQRLTCQRSSRSTTGRNVAASRTANRVGMTMVRVAESAAERPISTMTMPMRSQLA